MGNIQIEKSKDNYNILKINKNGVNCHLGSKYCQKREIDKFIDSLGILTEKDNYIILGAGTLEHIEALIEKKTEKAKIMVVEVDEEIISAISDLQSYKQTTKREDVIITSNIEEIKEFMDENINDLNVEFAKFVAFANYNKLYTNELMDSYKAIKDSIIAAMLERNTRLQFKDDWVDASLQNSKYLCNSLEINHFKDKYKGIPAIIVSAGPSLEKNIKDIDKDKAFIISGGRTLKPLLEVGIDPDFMTIIDGSEASYDLVKNYLDKTNTNLIYNEMTSANILDNYSGDKIVSAQSGFFKEVLGDEIVDIINGGSVANSMAFVAAYMGFNPVIFVGQDLAYTENKGHAECAKTEGVSTDGEKNYYSNSDIYVKGIDGSEIRTSLSLKSFKEALEKIIESFSDTEFINATEGGAFIEGAKVKTLKETLRDFKVLGEKTIDKSSGINQEILDKTINRLTENIQSTEKVIELTAKALKLLDKFKKAYFKGDTLSVDIINKDLNYLEKKINSEMKNLSIVNSVIYELSYELESNEKFIINKNDSKDNIISKKLDLNKEIYKGMNSICKNSIDKLKDTLNKMRNING